MMAAEKPAACLICGGVLVQSAVGRPRRYCGPVCRRAAEYAIRRAQALLLRAARGAQSAALLVLTCESWQRREAETRRGFWEAEVERLEGELRELLAGLGGEPDEDVSAAAAVLARRRRVG